MIPIQDLDARRGEILRALYDAADGSSTKPINLREVADHLNIEFDDAVKLIQYWGGEGMVKRELYDVVRITHSGMRMIENELRASVESSTTPPTSLLPSEIASAVERFQIDHPADRRTAFLMMRFGRTPVHDAITAAVRALLDERGIRGLRADDKSYSDDLFANVRAYMHGCSFGIAIFERIEAEDFNPNVSLEVGYLLGLGKPVLLLKDRTLRTLHTDLAGRLYVEFDPHHARETIAQPLSQWLRDKNLSY